MKLAHLADEIARKRMGEHLDWDTLRDICDVRTRSELPPSLLDRLTDMTMRRLERNAWGRPTLPCGAAHPG